MISKWKGEFLENMAIVFEKETRKDTDIGPDTEELYSQIGKLTVENEF